MSDKLILNEYDRGYLTGYAEALQKIMLVLTGSNTCDKSYDPCIIDNTYIHSYAFNLKDGGRHHPISDYESVEEIATYMATEAKEFILNQGEENGMDERDSDDM